MREGINAAAIQLKHLGLDVLVRCGHNGHDDNVGLDGLVSCGNGDDIEVGLETTLRVCVTMMIMAMVLLQSLMQNCPHYVLFQSIYTTQILRFRNRVLDTPTNMCSMCTQLIHLNTKSSVK